MAVTNLSNFELKDGTLPVWLLQTLLVKIRLIQSFHQLHMNIFYDELKDSVRISNLCM